MNRLYEKSMEYIQTQYAIPNKEFHREYLDVDALTKIIDKIVMDHPDILKDTDLLKSVALITRIDPKDRLKV